MKGESVMYQGRQISKDGFRAFIYGLNDKKKLVNSWDEYIRNIATGLWFSSIEDLETVKIAEELPAIEKVEASKPKNKRQKRG